MVINTNVAALAASRTLTESTNSLSASLARLSSGSKIVSPEDDAAGLAQSIRFDAQINRNHAVQSNLNNTISFSQTQDGFLVKAQSALDRMSELSVLAQDMTKTNTDRSNYSVEFVQLQRYTSDIGTKNFNGVSLFPANESSVMDIDSLTGTSGGTGGATPRVGQSFTPATSGYLTKIVTTSVGGVSGTQLENGVANAGMVVRQYINDNELTGSGDTALDGTALGRSIAGSNTQEDNDLGVQNNPEYYPKVTFNFSDNEIYLESGTKYVLEFENLSGVGVYVKHGGTYGGGQTYDIDGINLASVRDISFAVHIDPGGISAGAKEVTIDSDAKKLELEAIHYNGIPSIDGWSGMGVECTATIRFPH